MKFLIVVAALLGVAAAAPSISIRDGGSNVTIVHPGTVQDMKVTKENTLNGTYHGAQTQIVAPADISERSGSSIPLEFVNNFLGKAVNAYLVGLDPAEARRLRPPRRHPCLPQLRRLRRARGRHGVDQYPPPRQGPDAVHDAAHRARVRPSACSPRMTTRSSTRRALQHTGTTTSTASGRAGRLRTAATACTLAAVARICAALIRSTLLLPDGDVQPGPAAGEYYKTDPTDHYSRLVHEREMDGRGYAFPYDDVNPGNENASGTVSSGSPKTLTVYVGGYSASSSGDDGM
ncbi:hypothetical protein ISF_09472 [Cordyceps fumosorosea ARSEF 2679]|uniref:GH64 domain-containing protein n=1 Tax=Cordyceps fumosorosea (strain ARSEF 2679) TaxID=1081104 RepID=A0A167I907_CORFA|nr:hypothetical protein ISF_09472 [Cordyceps fumosorosea ARSEF 2679]OAA48806.1 hypothetical protein ISF_09472 [Cordyceps fumosorosea ARSEF 2679]